MCCTRFLLPIHCKTAYRLPIRRACKEGPLLAVDGYSPVGAVRPPLIASAEHKAVGPCRRGRIPSCFTSAQCEIRRPWGTLKHHAPLRPRHGQSTASSARNPFPHTRAENDLGQPPPHTIDDTEISARFYLASYGPRSLKSLRRFREEVPQLSRPESRWCDVRSTRHRRIHGIGLSFTAELHSRASRPSSHTSRRTPSVFTLVGVHARRYSRLVGVHAGSITVQSRSSCLHASGSWS